MPETPAPIFTIGHSDRSLQQLVTLLRAAGVHAVVDARSVPGSRRYPHFSGDNLRMALEGGGMVYHWAGRQLGGMRQGNALSAHTALQSDGMRAFADYMETADFRKGVDQLIRLAGQGTLAILCAEKLPQHCHRNLIADYLVALGVPVRHLIDGDRTAEHEPSPLARWKPPYLVYDQPNQRSFPLDA